MAKIGILTLPKEVLLDILRLSLPYHFENLALTCKDVYSVATWLLKAHNSHRKRYRAFSFGSETVETVQELLAEIAADPIIASYIVHADLGGRQGLEEDDLPFTFPDDVPDELSRLVRESRHLAALSSDPDFSRSWLKGIVEYTNHFDHEVDFPVAFLLTLLTNVESLGLPGDWRRASAIGNPDKRRHDELNSTELSVSALVSLLIAHANEPKMPDQPLQKLHTLNPTEDIDGQFGEDMRSIFPFLALDSLRMVRHRSGVYEPRDQEYDLGYCSAFPTIAKNIDVLKLQDYVVSHQGAQILFKDMHKLRELEFDFAPKDEIGYDFQAMEFLQHLQRNTGRSLEALVLTSRIMDAYDNHAKPSLRGFSVLRHLEIATDYFVDNRDNEEDDESSDDEDEGDDEGDGEDEDEDEDDNNEQDEKNDQHDESKQSEDIGDNVELSGELSDMREYWKDVDTEEYKTLRLVKHFPPSLQTIVIRSRATARDCKFLEKLFGKFGDCREKSLPLLKEVNVHMTKCGDWNVELDDFQTHVDHAAEFFSHQPFVTFHATAVDEDV